MDKAIVTVNSMDTAVTPAEMTVVLGSTVLCIVSIVADIVEVNIVSFAVGVANCGYAIVYSANGRAMTIAIPTCTVPINSTVTKAMHNNVVRLRFAQYASPVVQYAFPLHSAIKVCRPK